MEAIDRLPEAYREVILLRFPERLGFKAIGQRMGRSDESVQKLFARAIAQLTAILNPRAPSPAA